MFFMTWARRDGWPEQGLPDYASMQHAVDETYRQLAAEQHAVLAPVGSAWFEATRTSGGTDLWQDDGIHPTLRGTYLAACVFYATVFRQSPVGLAHPADLPVDTADTMQRIAASVVLGKPRH